MAYKLVTKYNSPNFTPASDVPAVFGHKRQILSGTNHHWGDLANKPQFWSTVNWVCRRGGNTSAHVVAQSRLVAVLIDYANAAWANGNAFANATSISLELNPRASRGDKNTAGEFWADMWMFYGQFPLFEHNDWAATACPGRYSKQDITRRAEKYYAKKLKKTQKPQKEILPVIKPKPKPKPKPAPKKQAQGLFWVVERGDTLSEIAEYYYGDARKWRKIAKSNKLSRHEANNLRVGQTIAISGPLYWRVEVGDDLQKIADYFGIPSWKTVQRNAGIKDPQTLRAGQLIRVY